MKQEKFDIIIDLRKIEMAGIDRDSPIFPYIYRVYELN